MERGDTWQPPGLGTGRRAVTSATSITAADQGVTIDATSGTFTVGATAAATLGSGFSCALYNSGTGVVTLDPNGSETVRTPSGTSTTVVLKQGEGVFLSCTGTGFEAVAYARSTLFNVRDFGAVGDGVTDDTVAVAAATNACTAAGGGVVFFPPTASSYLLSQQGTAWGTNKYCVRPTASAASVIFKGCGDSSAISLAAHQHGSDIWFMFVLNKLTGKVVFEDIRFSIPAPVNPGGAPGQGPACITVGEIGATSETGALSSLIVQRCTFTNPSFFVHGEGCASIVVRDCIGVAKGGGTYPTYFCEPFNFASATTTTLMDLTIDNCTVDNDAVYGDHVVYTLGTFRRIAVRNCQWDGVLNEAVKFDGGSVAGQTTEALIVENNIDTRSAYVSGGTSSFLTLSSPSSTPSCRLLRVVGNVCRFAHQAVYAEWAFNEAIVAENDFQSTYDIGVHFLKDAALALVGRGVIRDNNFINGNTSAAAGANYIKAECFTDVEISGNKLSGLSGSRSISDGQMASQRTVCVGNVSNLSPAWVAGDNPQNLVDLGNSWNAYQVTVAAAPTVGTWRVNDIAWKLVPTAGGVMGWLCTTAGTPGTWTDFYAVTSGTQTIPGAKTFSTSVAVSSGDATVGANAAASANLKFNAAASNQRGFAFQTAGTNLWSIVTGGTESGADAGANIQFVARTDAGSTIDVPIQLNRAAGAVIAIARPLTISSSTDATSTTTGSITTLGGGSHGVTKSWYGGGFFSLSPTIGIGYATGAGGTVAQAGSRTTGVTLNKVTGQITLVSAAGSAAWQTFVVTNSAVAAADTVLVVQKSGADLYQIHVTAVAAGSFAISFATTGGTTVEQPVFTFTVMKGASA